jgi:hypothetical protein
MYLDRLQGAKDERPDVLAPVTGLMDLPVPSFAEVAAALTAVVPGMQGLTQRVLQYAAGRCASGASPAPSLSLDEAAAVHLYTLQSPFYSLINAALRCADRAALEPYRLYLRLLLAALPGLAPVAASSSLSTTQLWRGVALDLSKQYPLVSTRRCLLHCICKFLCYRARW